MKKLLFLLLFLTAGENSINAQGLPAYICDTTKPGTWLPILGTLTWIPFDASVNLVQPIYYLSDFPGLPPQGFITDVFIKLAYATPAGSTLEGLTVKLGITSLKKYFNIGNVDSFFFSIDSTLTTVFYDTAYVLTTSLAAGDWWRLPLQQPFQYSLLPLPNDVPQNLMLQLSRHKGSDNDISYLFNMCFILDSMYLVGKDTNRFSHRALNANKNISNQTHITGMLFGIYLIGFNGYALSVDDPNKIKPFSVFPNPARDKLSLKGEIKGRYKIYSFTGKKLLEGSLRQGEFIDVGNLSAGMYLLEAEGRTFKFLKE